MACEYPNDEYETEPFQDGDKSIYLKLEPVRTPTGSGKKDPKSPCVLSEMLNEGQLGLANTRRCKRCNCIITVVASAYPYIPTS